MGHPPRVGSRGVAPSSTGLYVVGGSAPGWHQDLWLTHIGAGEGSVAIRRSAAALWGFDGVPAGLVEFAVPAGHQRRDRRVRRDAALQSRS